MDNMLWNLFMNTGNISFYLEYKGIQAEEVNIIQNQGEFEVPEVVLR